jgi:hypothetical protein
MALQLKPIVPKTISFWIRGTSPLIQHAWSEKGLRQMRMTAAERKKQPKVARDPESEADAAMHKMEDGSPGFPMLAFKAALISAAHKDLGIEKTLVKKSLFLPSAYYEKGLIGQLEGSEPVIREDIVRIGQNQTDLRYRPEFDQWRVNVIVQIDSDLLNEQDVINLVNRAGFSVGIGEWRPEKGGEYGRFEFDTSEVMREVNPNELEAVA